MTAVALMIRPTNGGWAVYLTNGQELARYRGPGSNMLATRYLQRYARAAGVSDRQSRQRRWHPLWHPVCLSPRRRAELAASRELLNDSDRLGFWVVPYARWNKNNVPNKPS